MPDTLVSEIATSEFDDVGVHFTCGVDYGDIDGLQTREEKQEGIATAFYQTALTARIVSHSTGSVTLETEGGHRFELRETQMDDSALYAGTDEEATYIQKNGFRAGQQVVYFDSTDEPTAVPTSCDGVTVEQRSSEYRDGPYYTGTITGFLTAAEPRALHITTSDGYRFIVGKDSMGNESVSYVDPSGVQKSLDAIHLNEGGIPPVE